MDPDLIEQLNEQFREMSDILSRQNTLMAAQVRNMNNMTNGMNSNTGSVKNNTGATNDNTKSTENLTEAQLKAKESVDKLNNAIGKTTQAFTPLISALLDTTQGLKKYSDAAGQFGQQMADMGKNSGSKLGVIFGHLTDVATKLTQREILNTESLLKFNDEISKFGAVNRFSTDQIREMGQNAMLSAQEVGKAMDAMKKLGPAFTSMGQGAADSTKKYMEFITTTEEERQKFRLMGYASDEERFEAQSMFLEALSASGVSIRNAATDVDKLRKASMGYLEHLNTLADITGKTVEEQQKASMIAAAVREFELYTAGLNAKIAQTTDEREKARLQAELNNAIKAKDLAYATGGEAGVADLSQRMFMGFSVVQDMIAQHAILGTEAVTNELVRAVKSGGDITAAQDEYIRLQKEARTSMLANNTGLMTAAMIDPSLKAMTGTDAAGIEFMRATAGKDTDEAAKESRTAIEALNNDLGPAAEDAAQKLRKFADELEKDVKIGLDNIQQEIGLLPQMIATGALGAITVGTTLYSARKLASAAAMMGGGAAAGGGADSAGGAAAAGGAMAAGKGMFKTPGGILLDPKQAEAYNALQQQREAALQTGKKSRFGKLGGMLSNAGGKLGKFGLGRIAGGLGGLAGGLLLDAGADMATEAGYTKIGAGLGVGSSALTGASTGALIGSVIPGLGTAIGGAIGGALGGAYGLYQNWDKLTGKESKTTSKPVEARSPNAASGDHFTRSVTAFGRITTSFGRIVTAYGTTTIGFIKASKKIENAADDLAKLSLKEPTKVSTQVDTKGLLSITESFGRIVAAFGSMVTSFGSIISSFGKFNTVDIKNTNSLEQSIKSLEDVIKPKNNKLLGTFGDDDEQESLIDYIEKLKNKFKETTLATDEMLDQETKRHNFNELSMLKFRQSIDDITEKFGLLSKKPIFGGFGGDSIGGGGGGINNTVLDAIAKAEGTYDTGYNTSYGNGRYLPGGQEQNLTEMTLREVSELGRYMRKQPGNPNSSAMGRYQILTTSTMLDAAKALGMDLDTTKFDERTQDQMAMWIAKQQGLGAWEGFKKHPELLRQAQQALANPTMLAGTLKELHDKGILKLGGGITGNEHNLENLNPKLERSMVAAISEYYQRTKRPVTLTSGFRYPGDQAKISSGRNPKAAPGKSRHERGLALDFNSSDISAMNQLGILEKYGLIGGKASARGGGYINDPPHVEIKAAQGGIFDGPSSGYPAELHGSEMVAPLDTNSILMKLATTPASATAGDITASTSKIEKEIIEKISTTNLETMQALLDKFDSLINAIEEGNSVRDKMYKSSMI